MPELERWVLHRLTELDARIRAAVAQLRLDRRLSGAAQFLRHRPVGVLFRYPQGRGLLRPAGQPAPPRRAHRAGPSAPLPDAPGSRRCCASPPRKPGAPASATPTACICNCSPTCRRDWRDDALAAKWETIRAIRRRITVPIEEARRANTLGAVAAGRGRRCRWRPTRRSCCRRTNGPRSRIVSAVHPVAGSAEDLADGRAGAGREMRPLLAGAAGGRPAAGPPALCLRCTDAVEFGAGVPARRDARRS